MTPTDGRVHLTSSIGYCHDGKVGVVLVIPDDCFVEVPGGGRVPGFVMTPGQARELAFAFLLQAEQIANGMLPPGVAAPRSDSAVQ